MTQSGRSSILDLQHVQIICPPPRVQSFPPSNPTVDEMASSGDLPSEILLALSKSEPILSQETFPNATFAEVKAALDKLASRSMVTYQTLENDEAALEPEAEGIVANGSHEARVFEALRQAVEGLTVQDLEKAIGDKNVTKVGQGKAFKEKWISKTSDGKLKASVSTSRPRHR